jgi:hypothetical protein
MLNLLPISVPFLYTTYYLIDFRIMGITVYLTFIGFIDLEFEMWTLELSWKEPSVSPCDPYPIPWSWEKWGNAIPWAVSPERWAFSAHRSWKSPFLWAMSGWKSLVRTDENIWFRMIYKTMDVYGWRIILSKIKYIIIFNLGGRPFSHFTFMERRKEVHILNPWLEINVIYTFQ